MAVKEPVSLCNNLTERQFLAERLPVKQMPNITPEPCTLMSDAYFICITRVVPRFSKIVPNSHK